MPKTIRLAVYFNDSLRAVRELALPFVIGRSREANLTVPHPMVSRRHCLVFDDRGTIRLRDLGSLNGTFSGTERIQDRPLHDGDEFLIGNIRFVFNPALDDGVAVDLSGDGSDFVNADVLLESSDDLPPPLPPPTGKQTAKRTGGPNPVGETPATPPPLPENTPGKTPASSLPAGSPTTPSFIKPLPISLAASDEANDGIELNELNNVIDLAELADKKNSNTPGD